MKDSTNDSCISNAIRKRLRREYGSGDFAKKMKNNVFSDKKGGILIVAEISANHGQNFNRAVAMIRAAKKCGAGAVKFQAYTPDTMTVDSHNKYFRIDHPVWGGQTLYDLYRKASTPLGWFEKLKKISEDLDMTFFATAFDKTSVDFLEGLGVPFHKIASFELVDLPLIEHAGRTKKPIILSTGMASLSEIKEAVETARKAGAKEVALLKCVSGYPARPEEMNLRTIPDLKSRFNAVPGLSDHTLGIGVSVAAVSLGVQLIEKHFTLSRKITTPDSFFSVDPHELKNLVDNVRMAEKATGKVHYGPTGGERKSRIFRRSLFAVKDVRRGELFTEKNVRSLRPGYGLPPKYIKHVLGKKAASDIDAGAPLTERMIQS